MSMKYVARALLLSALLALSFACKKKEAEPSAAKAPEATQAEKAKEEKKVALPEPLQKMHDRIAAISSAAAGVERATQACGAEKELADLAASIKKLPPPAGVDAMEWESGQDQLVSLMVGLAQACTDGGGPEGATEAVESTLEQIRDQADALVAYIAGDKEGNGDKDSGN